MTAAPEPRPSASKPLLTGCGVALVVLLLLCGGGAVLTWNYFRGQVERIAKDEEFAEKWSAPAADAPAEAFAPDPVAGYDLAETDDKAPFPALGIDREGSHAVYRKGGDTIDIAVYRADEAAKTAVFDEVQRRIDDPDRFKSHTFTRLPRTLRFGVTDPTTLHGVLWHADGWLVFVRSTTVADLDPFLRAYLEAVGKTPEAAIDPAPTEAGATATESETAKPQDTAE